MFRRVRANRRPMASAAPPWLRPTARALLLTIHPQPDGIFRCGRRLECAIDLSSWKGTCCNSAANAGKIGQEAFHYCGCACETLNWRPLLAFLRGTYEVEWR